MASEIERALYGQWAEQVSPSGEVGRHCVVEIALAEGVVRLRVAPCERQLAEWSTAIFRKAELGEIVETASEPDDLMMPWYITGFYSHHAGDGQWRFVLNCGSIRWRWASGWPEIERHRAD